MNTCTWLAESYRHPRNDGWTERCGLNGAIAACRCYRTLNTCSNHKIPAIVRRTTTDKKHVSAVVRRSRAEAILTIPIAQRIDPAVSSLEA